MYQDVLAVLSAIPLEKSSTRPVWLQISIGLVNSIRHGELRSGLKLPGTRVMAHTLNTHRKTLQMALDELASQGWLEVTPRKGTFVSREVPELTPRKNLSIRLAPHYPLKTGFRIKESNIFSFPRSDFQRTSDLIIAEGFPDIRLAPMNQLSREIRVIEKGRTFRKYLHYGNPQGTAYLRDTLSKFLRETRILKVSADNIIITRGAQMGLHVAAQVLLKPNDQVIVGDPGYVTATITLQGTGAVINKVPVDEHGIKIDHIARLCQRKKIRLVYVIPHHHHPTTVTLSAERRIRLLSLAQQYNFAIIEDDYDYDFHYTASPIVPMASLDQNGNVIYIGTLSKTLAPAIRVGFMIAPKNFIDEAVAVRRSIDFQGDSILEIAIAELYKNGIIQNHIKKVVKIYRQRRDHFCALLREQLGEYVSFRIPDGGLSVWTHFKKVNLEKVTTLAAKRKLIMFDGSIYNTKFSSNATRLGFSSLNFSEQDEAVDILLKCIKQALLKK